MNTITVIGNIGKGKPGHDQRDACRDVLGSG